jgi:hypothetical protein
MIGTEFALKTFFWADEFTRMSAEGEWDSLLGQLRSRALRATSPETSLREGQWVKLICGASFEVCNETYLERT